MASEEKLSRRVRTLLKDVAWILRRARKPKREDYMTIVKLSLLLIFILGAYSLIFSFIGYALTSRASILAVPYPENIMIIAVIIIVIVAVLVYLIVTTRGVGSRR